MTGPDSPWFPLSDQTALNHVWNARKKAATTGSTGWLSTLSPTACVQARAIDDEH